MSTQKQKSTFRNWRKSNINSKVKPLSCVFPVSAKKNSINGLSIEFQTDIGERITFDLNESDTGLLLMHIDKRYLGKDINRSDYKLEF